MGVAAGVAGGGVMVGGDADPRNGRIRAGLLRAGRLGAPDCLGEQAAEGSTRAVARGLGAAVCAAPEVVESMDAAGGGAIDCECDAVLSSFCKKMMGQKTTPSATKISAPTKRCLRISFTYSASYLL